MRASGTITAFCPLCVHPVSIDIDGLVSVRFKPAAAELSVAVQPITIPHACHAYPAWTPDPDLELPEQLP